MVDKAKAVKTVLMSLFTQNGNYDVEGVDSTNACYGATQALFNSVAYIESSAYEYSCCHYDYDNDNDTSISSNNNNNNRTKYSLVIAGDIAVYEKGPARPTGGAGVVAMLIGPDASIVLDKGRVSYFEHAWDFYKPKMDSEYAVVDGRLSNSCYLKAMMNCYYKYKLKPHLVFYLK